MALQIVLGVLAGWLDRREREAIVYLIDENRLLRRQLGGHRLRVAGEFPIVLQTLLSLL
jgi:hypothetical protein